MTQWVRVFLLTLTTISAYGIGWLHGWSAGFDYMLQVIVNVLGNG